MNAIEQHHFYHNDEAAIAEQERPATPPTIVDLFWVVEELCRYDAERGMFRVKWTNQWVPQAWLMEADDGRLLVNDWSVRSVLDMRHSDEDGTPEVLVHWHRTWEPFHVMAADVPELVQPFLSGA
jgi:hypothetical protein